jgi:hypothetical protein
MRIRSTAVFKLKASLLLLTVVAITACLPAANYEDVSHKAPYDLLVGAKYRTRLPLVILGITDDRNYKPPIDYYYISETRSLSDPEILERATLMADSVVEVARVLRCTNCPFEEVLRIEVTISSSDAYRGKPVFVVNVGKLLDIGANKGVTLNTEFFEPIAN